MRSTQLFIKRAVDVAVSSTLLVALSPVLLAVAGALWLRMGRPVLYGQLRPGLREQTIRVWKFRTMTDDRDSEGRLLPDGERLTRLGRALRASSLDELPQLFNVLSGDMSLVGPRPLLLRYLPRYTARQRSRHLAKPGITGWAQVNGRNATDWATRLEHDAWYVEHFSLALDLRIILLTCRNVLARKDVMASAGAEFDEFWGTLGVPQTGPRAFPVETDERN